MSFLLCLLLASILVSSFAVASAQSTDSSITASDDEIRSQFIPWSWVVKPDTAQPICPPASATLGTFAAVNGVVAVVTLLTGNRVILYHISFGLLGKPKSHSWRYMWLLSLCTQLGANALVAYLYRVTPGYNNSVSMWQLVLFFTTRPRLGWLVMYCLSQLGQLRKEFGEYAPIDVYFCGRYTNTSDSSNEKNRPGNEDRPYVYGYYEGTALCLMVAELPLILISMYYYGRTAHFATTKGYYIIGHLTGPHAHDAHLMYAGALLALIGGAYSIVFVPMQLFVNDATTRSAPPDPWLIYFSITLMTYGWIGAWLFWVGYVRLAGDLYCPPKLIESGSIWAAFSVFGSIFGGTF